MTEKDIKTKTGRTPSMGVSLLVIGVMIFLILFSAAFFGGKVAAGPLQVSLTLALLFALLVARLHGFRDALIGDAIRSSVNGTLGTVFVLMAIGALIGSLYLAGTVPAFIYYGVMLVSPKFYYVTVFIIAALLTMVIGSSATVAGMIGVAFVGLASIMGVSPGITAGAAVSGTVVGFTAARISPGVNLTVNAVGVSVDEYAPLAMRMSITTALISAGIYLVMGLTGGSTAAAIDPSQVQDSISQHFNINLLAFLPIVLILVMAAMRFTAFMSLMLPALFAVALAGFTQHELIISLAADPNLSYFQAFLNVGIDTLGSGFHLNSGVEAMDQLFAGGGIAGMMNTIWLIMMAASFGAVADYTGMLGRIINPIIERAKGQVSLILVTMLTSMGLNVVMADLYGSALLGARMFKKAYQQQRLKPVTLAVAMMDSGSALAHIIPWNVLGAVLVGTLGLAIADFAPYAFAAYLAPVITFVVIYLSKGRMAGGEEDTAIAIDTQIEQSADDLIQLA
jgi:NhaC family Na+:H+ antiporter